MAGKLGQMERLFAAVTDYPDDGQRVQVVLTTDAGEPLTFSLGPANPKAPVRFAVGRPGWRSSVWRLWANRDRSDVYVATRQSAGIFKVSLHESGDWRLQWVGSDRGEVTFTSFEEEPPQGRVMHQWSRPPASATGWTDALSIWVPRQDVSEIPGDGEPGHDAQWLEPAAPGGATELRLVLVQPGRGLFELTAALRGPDASLALVNGFRLAGGEAALLFAATQRLNRGLRQDLEKVRQRARAQAAPGFDLDPQSGPRTAVIDVNDDGHRNLWDLSLADAQS